MQVQDGEVDARNQFEQFMNKYKKSYPDGGEFDKRFRIFRANLKKIDALNKYEQGTATYGVTQFADLTSKYEPEVWHKWRMRISWSRYHIESIYSSF